MARPAKRPPRGRVLLVEDDHDTAEALALLLEVEGYVPVRAATAQQAYDLLARPEPGLDVILLDLTLPDKSGALLVEEVAQIRACPCVIIMSAAPENVLQTAARRLQAVGYLRKPFETGALFKMLHQALPRTANPAT